MRALALAAVAIAGCTAPPPAIATPAPTPEPGVLAVTALLDLSGSHAAIGAQQRDALQLWMDQWQGRTRTPAKLRTVDVAGSEAKLLIELRRAAVEAAATAVVVGTPVADEGTLERAIDVAALPVLLLEPLASDPAARAGGRWAFALAPSMARLASMQIDDAIRRDVLVPSLVLADGREQIDAVASALTAELERRRLEGVARIALPADGGVPPMVRSSLPVLRSVHCTALAAACAAVARDARSASAPTLLYLSYLVTPAEIRDDRDLAARAIWPSTRTLVPPSVLRDPVDHARADFLKAYGERHGTASVHAATAYDALALLAAAADRGGTGDRAALRDALERITMPLIASTYSFAPDRHAGSDPADVAYLRWSGSAVVPVPSFGTVIATPSLTPTPIRTAAPPPSAAP